MYWLLNIHSILLNLHSSVKLCSIDRMIFQSDNKKRKPQLRDFLTTAMIQIKNSISFLPVPLILLQYRQNDMAHIHHMLMGD